MKMQFQYKGNTHTVVYIVYHDGIPHSVTTIAVVGGEGKKYRRPYDWDFVIHHDWKELMYYNSGSGGSGKTIRGSHYVEGTQGVTYWMHKSMRMSKRYPAINYNRVDAPIELTAMDNGKTCNPFEVAQEVADINYCEECNGYYNEEHCRDHVEWSEEEGNWIYLSTGKAVG